MTTFTQPVEPLEPVGRGAATGADAGRTGGSERAGLECCASAGIAESKRARTRGFIGDSGNGNNEP